MEKRGKQMNNDLFGDIDPWERIIMLQLRVEQLEAVNNQIIDAINIQRKRADLADEGIQTLQRFIMENKL